MDMLFVCYPKCTTCQKAERWLKEKNINYTFRNIKEDNPRIEELRDWYERSGLDIKRFFNTSGLIYKEMKLKDRLPDMTIDEKLELLSTDGMLVKRPILVCDDFVLTGFKESEWENCMKLLQDKERNMKTALSIAGSDCSGGAGVQADIKTMTVNGVYAMSVVTALTAQNTMGVTGIMEVTPEFLAKQLDSVFADIYPDAVKIGMVSSSALIDVIADKLLEYKAGNIVVDPVMVATSGSKLIGDEAVETLKKRLFPLADILTPNIPETEVLSGMKVKTADDMIEAARAISEKYGCAVLCKGGHKLNDANDLLYRDGNYKWFNGRRIDNNNTHGTGCTLSSAIASNMAKGCDIDTAVEKAKEYISGALGAMLDLGKGSGPMNHAFMIEE